MSDPGTRKADASQAEIEKRLRQIYQAAQRDMIRQLNDHSSAMYARDAEQRKKLAAGKITQAQYRDWLRGQMFTDQTWKDKISSVASTLLNANRTANRIVEGERRAVFVENRNYTAYRLEKGLNGAISFNLYDSAAVTRLLRDQPELLPPKRVNGVRDKAWNREKIASITARGIISGASIPEIAQNIAAETASSNMKAMERYARTAMTGAQNAGRMEMLHEACDMGIRVKKVWLATLDRRTRHAHMALNGQIQDIDKPFDSELGPIMYPGDPDADEANTWNCRCTLIYEYEEYTKPSGSDEDDGEDYEEWKEQKSEDEAYIPEILRR